MIYGNANDIADKYFKSVISSYQNGVFLLKMSQNKF